MSRRLFQCLEQSIEGGRAQHVDLIDEINAEFASGGQKTDILSQLADLLHPVVAGAVNLQNIEIIARSNFSARIASATGCLGRTIDTIEGFGKNTSRRCLSYPTGTDKEVGVGQTFIFDGVAQRPDDRILAEDLLEQLRTVFAGKDLITHR